MHIWKVQRLKTMDRALYLWLLKINFYVFRKEKKSSFLFIMGPNILKFTLQKEKKRIFIFKYCKIDVKSAATLIFAATLITAPTVVVAIASVLFRQKLHRLLHERQLDRDPLVLWL